MFASYPGFEDLMLRVEAEWCGQTRMVVARLEQWPESKSAVLVCAFEDATEDGEWIVIGGHGVMPYQMSNPYKLVTETRIYEVETRQPILQWKQQNQRKEKVQQIICKAFGNHKNYTLARLLKLDDLPSEPRVALRTFDKSVWLPTYAQESWVEFEGQAQQDLTESQEQSRLIRDCRDESSDAHFTWEWVKLSDTQREHRLGFIGDKQQLGRVMSLVLTARNHQWEDEDWFLWQFDVNAETGEFFGLFDNSNPKHQQQTHHALSLHALSLWDELLIAKYASSWRPELFMQHKCVKQYLDSKYYEFGYAFIEHPPSAHEQLEAKLALRDWLAGAATPDVAAALLASLES